jgi:CRP/FNR family transcriptional regulator, cyclic AMP receptor protein
MKSDFIRRVPLFATLSDTEFKTLEHIFLIRSYRKHQVIFLEEETGTYMYIVLAGKLKVTKSTAGGKENILAIHRPGDFFGDMALLDGKTSPATVSAMEDCRIAYVSKADFNSLLMTNEKVVLQMVQVLCGRLRQVWGQIQSLSYSSAEARIKGGILELARKHGVPDARGIIIDLKITHQEVAEMVGTSRETVTRTLARLRDERILLFEGRRIILLQPQALLPRT